MALKPAATQSYLFCLQISSQHSPMVQPLFTVYPQAARIKNNGRSPPYSIPNGWCGSHDLEQGPRYVGVLIYPDLSLGRPLWSACRVESMCPQILWACIPWEAVGGGWQQSDPLLDLTFVLTFDLTISDIPLIAGKCGGQIFFLKGSSGSGSLTIPMAPWVNLEVGYL